MKSYVGLSYVIFAVERVVVVVVVWVHDTENCEDEWDELALVVVASWIDWTIGGVAH